LAASADVDTAIKGRLIADSMLLSSATEPWLEAWGQSQMGPLPPDFQPDPVHGKEFLPRTSFGLFEAPASVQQSQDMAVSPPLDVSERSDAAARRAAAQGSTPWLYGRTAPGLTSAMKRQLFFRWSWENSCLPLTSFERLLPTASASEDSVFHSVLSRIPAQASSRTSSRQE